MYDRRTNISDRWFLELLADEMWCRSRLGLTIWVLFYSRPFSSRLGAVAIIAEVEVLIALYGFSGHVMAVSP